DYQVVVERDRDRRNVAKLEIPYINSKESVEIAVLAAGGSGKRTCKVKLKGKGVQVLEGRRLLKFVPPALVFIAICVVAQIVSIESAHEWLPKTWFDLLGLTAEQRTITIMSWKFKIVGGAISLNFVFGLIYWFAKLLGPESTPPWLRHQKSADPS